MNHNITTSLTTSPHTPKKQGPVTNNIGFQTPQQNTSDQDIFFSPSSLKKNQNNSIGNKYSYLFEQYESKQKNTGQFTFKKDSEIKKIKIHVDSILKLNRLNKDNIPIIYDDLKDIIDKVVKNPQKDKNNTTIRFLVTMDGKMRFGQEGAPNNKIPAHSQMTETKTCVTAGNIIFGLDSLTNTYKITTITNKSGDFQPVANTLQYAIRILIEKYKDYLSDNLNIKELDHILCTLNKTDMINLEKDTQGSDKPENKAPNSITKNLFDNYFFKK
jgi:hypothetical protein